MRSPSLHCCMVTALGIAFAWGPGAARAAGWEEVAHLPWGDGEGEVGLHAGDEDELAYGPHGIAVDENGRVAVVDRIGGRVLILGPDGELLARSGLEGRPGAAALLADGEVAVLDEAEERTIRRSTAGNLYSPRWALPPTRLVTLDEGDERRLWGLDAFQQRLPLASQPTAVEPHQPERGVPATDGALAVVAVRDQNQLVLRFIAGDGGTEEVRLAVSMDSDERLAGVEVLAVGDDGAVVSYLALDQGVGPLRTRRVVSWIGRDGEPGATLDVPQPGPVAIPADLAATADGRVYLLRSEADGCVLWRVGLKGGGR